MRPEEVWPAALGQLQMEMNKTTFDTWVRDTRFLSYENGIFVIGTTTAHERDWLEDRLTGLSRKILTGIWGQPAEVRFAVAVEPGAMEETDAGPKNDPEGENPDAPVEFDTVYATVTDEIIKPDQVTTIPQALWRLSPFLGPTSTARYIGIRQKAFFSSTRDIAGVFEATLRELARFSGMSCSSWLKASSSPYEQWLFVRKTANVRRVLDRKTGKISTLPSLYTYYGSFPLSPDDQEYIREWFRLQEIERDPEKILNLAVEQPHHHLLAPRGYFAPPAAVPASPQTVEDIVFSLCSIDPKTAPVIRDLCHQLQSRLVGGFDLVPLYFICSVMPRLGYRSGLFVLWLRHLALRSLAYENAQLPAECTVHVPGGYSEISHVLGVSVDTVKSWFRAGERSDLLRSYAKPMESKQRKPSPTSLFFSVFVSPIPLLPEDKDRANEECVARVRGLRISLG